MIQPLLAAALLAAQAAQAAPAEPPCITRQEAGDMAVTLLPHLIDAMAQRCGEHLGAQAFLRTGAAGLAARLRQDAVPRRQSAMRGIGKIGGAAFPTAAGSEAGVDFLAAILTAAAASNVTPASCPDIDAIVQSLAPLPADNIARLVGSTFALAMNAEPRERRHEDGDDEHESNGEEAAPAGPRLCPT
ncbi:MAG TPA: hypothetical protein VGX37_10270 [Allosphingosinicella sp.]|nr:hypothetical protein [Allosphingosinicella sp.]